MRQINLVEGKVVAPEGMKVGIVAARFNEIIVNKLLGRLCGREREYYRHSAPAAAESRDPARGYRDSHA